MKHMIEDLFSKSLPIEKREEVLSFLGEVMDKVKKDDPHWWEHKGLKLHEIECGPHFNEEYAEMIIDNMVNVDGTEGAHWNLEASNEILEKWITNDHDKYNEFDWWVILNMMHSDYSAVLGNKLEIHVAMAKAYFGGPDEDEGKAWFQFKHKLKKLLKERV